ncbi:succinyldiaminopimelate transaminase [Humidisolicoccus flavus]|uniref:succinyldiaminopimelate transaminase n=1 Tax=Humidisolicoccus flavus TaxID=3111414 RepID=UPI00324CCB26
MNAVGQDRFNFPDFPWDSLTAFKQRAAAHPDGLIDLSVGSPVDPTPGIIQDALQASSNAPFYPTCWGTPALRDAIVAWFARRRRVPGLQHENVMPTVGSKETVAGLPLWLGLAPGDTVVFPEAAYPTYDIGARLAGATPLAEDDPALWPASTRLVWVNSPSNPSGRVSSAEELRAIVQRARELGAIVVSDECYAELPWNGEHVSSLLDPEISGGDLSDLLVVYSLSKQSNLAGYRAGILAGGEDLVQAVLAIRKHIGLMPPTPVQHAMTVALGDDAHVAAQRELYRARRATLLPALEDAGFSVDHSEAGLYLWSRSGRSTEETLSFLADLGILVAPGTFYGDDEHVRIAITASDEAIAKAAQRLRNR